MGFSIGTLIAILPTPGVSILLCIIVALIYKKVNKLTLFGSLAFWNPITMAPIYYFSYAIGHSLFGSIPVMRFKVYLFNAIYNFSRQYLVGNFIIAVVVSTISYFIVRQIAIVYEEDRIKNRLGASKHISGTSKGSHANRIVRKASKN
jgi:uncharacterized protein (DUF2062 family)